MAIKLVYAKFVFKIILQFNIIHVGWFDRPSISFFHSFFHSYNQYLMFNIYRYFLFIGIIGNKTSKKHNLLEFMFLFL